MMNVSHFVRHGAGIAGICEDGMTTNTDADTKVVEAAMDRVVESARGVRLGNALVSQMYSSEPRDSKTRAKRAAVIQFLRQLDRIERVTERG